MKIVIEIPDKYITNDTNLLDWMKLANDNKEFKCNPLPMGHGRLIDADAIPRHLVRDIDEIDKQPTIIEGSDAE